MALFGTSIVSLTPIVIIDLVGVENIETMSGINNVFEGLASITSTLVASEYTSVTIAPSGALTYWTPSELRRTSLRHVSSLICELIDM